jgi:hypothetical protein
MTDPITTERETLRRKLAKQAADGESAQAEVKAAAVRLRDFDAAERERVLGAAAQRKELSKQRDLLFSRAKAAGDALDRLRQEFVSVDVRQGLSSAKREASSAAASLRRAEQDLSGARVALEELRHRFATMPSGASPVDLRATIKRAEEEIAAPEARLALAREAVQAATSRLALAQGAYDAAMAAARAL